MAKLPKTPQSWIDAWQEWAQGFLRLVNDFNRADWKIITADDPEDYTPGALLKVGGVDILLWDAQNPLRSEPLRYGAQIMEGKNILGEAVHANLSTAFHQAFKGAKRFMTHKDIVAVEEHFGR